MSWNDDRVEMLKNLWDQGLSAQVIAERINAAYGTEFTRSAVIGKRSRLSLPERVQSPARNKGRRSRPAAARIANDGKVKPVQTNNSFNTMPRGKVAREEPWRPKKPRPATARALVELEANECRWPYGDPRRPDFRMCGDRTLPNQVYCREHMVEAVYVIPKKVRKRRAVDRPYQPKTELV